MDRKINKYVLSILGILTGCTPVIEQHYDEFKQTNICKMSPQLIRNEYKVIKSRQVYLSLETQPSGSVKGIITTKATKGWFSDYDTFREKARVKFTLTKDKRINDLEFIGDDIKNTVETVPVYTQYGTQITYSDHNYLSFMITRDQLHEIITASEVTFLIEVGKNPIEGYFSSADKDKISQFVTTCLKK